MTEVPAVAPAPVPPSAGEPKPNPIARIIGVLVSPDSTFASIARKPDWIAPLIVLIVLSIASGVVMSSRVDWAAPAREQFENNKDMPPERAAQAEKFAAAMGKGVAYLAPLFVIVFMLITAGILLLAFRLFGGEGTFKQAWAATLYAQMPNVIKSIVMLIIMVARGGDLVSPILLPSILRSNPAFLFDPKTNLLAYSLAANFDIFGIWVLILCIIGFAHLARVSKGKSAAIIISLWIVKCLFGLIGPAMQSLRK